MGGGGWLYINILDFYKPLVCYCLNKTNQWPLSLSDLNSECFSVGEECLSGLELNREGKNIYIQHIQTFWCKIFVGRSCTWRRQAVCFLCLQRCSVTDPGKQRWLSG